jgi:hypothetical protein
MIFYTFICVGSRSLHRILLAVHLLEALERGTVRPQAAGFAAGVVT